MKRPVLAAALATLCATMLAICVVLSLCLVVYRLR